MALITCQECGHTMSDAAHACPQCGAPRDVALAPDVQARRPTASYVNVTVPSPIGSVFCVIRLRRS